MGSEVGGILPKDIQPTEEHPFVESRIVALGSHRHAEVRVSVFTLFVIAHDVEVILKVLMPLAVRGIHLVFHGFGGHL